MKEMPNFDLIDNLTQDIINIYNIEVPIKNMNIVVKKLGGSVRENFVVKEYSRDSMLQKIGDGFRIYVKEDDPRRTRFRIAQELGILFLDMGYLTDVNIWDKYKDNEIVDFSHNSLSVMSIMTSYYFAHALLMPKGEYIKVLNDKLFIKDDELLIKDIAEYFNVTPENVRTRGCDLKLRKRVFE